MSIRALVAVSSLIALAATPLAALADGANKATDACIQAFVDAYVPKDRTVRVRKKSPAPGPLASYTREYTVALSAHLAESGTELATARCVASPGGQVLVIDSPPIETYAANADVVVRLK